MSVLIEGINVIITNEAIERCFGPLIKFIEQAPNNTACHDNYITRIGFMDPNDVNIFILFMEKYGMIHLANGKSVDIIIIDQISGPTSKCDWCDIGTVMIFKGDFKVKIASHKDEEGCVLKFPNGWKYENSLSHTGRRVDGDIIKENLEYLETDDKIETWIDKKTGKKFYVGRTSNIR